MTKEDLIKIIKVLIQKLDNGTLTKDEDDLITELIMWHENYKVKKGVGRRIHNKKMETTYIRQKLIKFKIVAIDTVNKNVTVKMIELTNKRKEQTRCLLEGDEWVAKLETHVQLKEVDNGRS